MAKVIKLNAANQILAELSKKLRAVIDEFAKEDSARLTYGEVIGVLRFIEHDLIEESKNE